MHRKASEQRPGLQRCDFHVAALDEPRELDAGNEAVARGIQRSQGLSQRQIRLQQGLHQLRPDRPLPTRGGHPIARIKRDTVPGQELDVMDVTPKVDDAQRVLEPDPGQAIVENRRATLAPQLRRDAEGSARRQVRLGPILEQLALPSHDQLLNSPHDVGLHSLNRTTPGEPLPRAAAGLRTDPSLGSVRLVLEQRELGQRRRPMFEELLLLAAHVHQHAAQVAAVPAVVGGAEDRYAAAAVMPLEALAAVRNLMAANHQPQVVRLQKPPGHIGAEGNDGIASGVRPDALALVRIGPNAVEKQNVHADTRALGQQSSERQPAELGQSEVAAPQASVDHEDLAVNE
mmetsp:Transcript_30193/g.99917  ORF Transcript_30193/g.99917 Transcript_30193/m.99917 type:complete len:345 (+) Transcript_30193:871-1905(+)